METAAKVENVVQEEIIKEKSSLEEKFLPFPFEEFKKNLLKEKVDFIEIDLEQMKTNLYRAGETIKEIPVLAKGNPTTWTGNPAGLYSINRKIKTAFSVSEKVYMPYSMNFYGKYEMHGPPYYPDGSLLKSRSTGGCIRFSKENIKILYNFAEKGMPILITNAGFKKDDYQYLQPELISDFPEISAKSYLTADFANGFVFLEKNSKDALPIASLTKLMTALVVAENRNFKKSILVTQKMIEPFRFFDWFKPKLKIGKSYRIIELFYPSLISSSNDAAEVLSYFLGKEKTIELMNEKAKSIGMENTKFSEPTGLGNLINSEENLSTARDLFYLGQYLLNVRPLFLKITKGEKVQSFGPVSFDIKSLKNKNIFFKEVNSIGNKVSNGINFIGGKTGYTETAGSVGLFIFELSTKNNEKRKIAIILLNSENLKNDTQNILNWLNKNYFNNLSF